MGADPRCAYDALFAAYALRMHETRGMNPDTTPFFVTMVGKIYDTSTVRKIAKRIALIIDIPIEEVGAKSFRIGGASCLRESHGEAAASNILKEHGRWHTDIGFIYARSSVQTGLNAHRRMLTAIGQDVERATGYTQPGR